MTYFWPNNLASTSCDLQWTINEAFVNLMNDRHKIGQLTSIGKLIILRQDIFVCYSLERYLTEPRNLETSESKEQLKLDTVSQLQLDWTKDRSLA